MNLDLIEPDEDLPIVEENDPALDEQTEIETEGDEPTGGAESEPGE